MVFKRIFYFGLQITNTMYPYKKEKLNIDNKSTTDQLNISVRRCNVILCNNVFTARLETKSAFSLRFMIITK